MAHSEAYMNKDLTECGICLMVIEEPKALPCLHTYCLKCLSKWAEGTKDKVRCPICIQDFIIPPEGVKGFITNFFINTLKDRRETAEKLHAEGARIPCSCCGERDNKAEAYCTDCGGFICEECGITHKRVFIMQNHKTIAFADLQSGKVDVKNVMKQECCKEHKGQVLKFYCKSCGVLICHECTVIDHPGTSHSLVNLKSATKEQMLEVRELMRNCTKVRDTVNESLKRAEKIQDNLEQGLKKAKVDLHQAAEAVRANLLADVQKKEIEQEAKIIQAATDNKKQLDAQKESLMLQQTRLHTALQMASEVTETGSDYDLALVYSSLKNNLTQLRNMKPENVDENLGVIAFVADKRDLFTIPTLGSLSVKSQDHMPKCIGEWKMENKMAMDGLANGRSIAVTPIGDLIVTDYSAYNSMGNAYIYSHEGKFKFGIDTKRGLKHGQTTRPMNVVVSPDGRIFITHDVHNVNVYNTNGTFKYLFPTKSPSNVFTDEQNSKLYGLALDNQGHVLVGEINEKYISKHALDGAHVNSFKLTIAPWYIAVTPRDLIIVSSGGNIVFTDRVVQILNSTGRIFHTLNPPSGVSTWMPYGLCCTTKDEVYVANNRPGNDGGIYCYSVSGHYLRCITNEVTNPAGLALTDKGNKLMVVEESQIVKIFRRQ